MYLAALGAGVAGMLVLDARLRLFLFAAPLRAGVVLVVGVAGFLLWDSAGIGLGIFFEGSTPLLVGVDLAPEVPVEELVFLLLLCLTAMDGFLLAGRVLAAGGPLRRRLAAAGRPAR